MEKVQDLVGMEDKALPLLIRKGLNIVGRASCSPFFNSHEEPQKVTLSEFQASARKRAPSSIRKTEFMARQGGREMSLAIWKKVEAEIKEGALGMQGNYFGSRPRYPRRGLQRSP